MDLSIAPDAFRNELYTSTSPSEFDFDAVITHRATVTPAPTKQPDTAGADAALAALQNSMASYQQEKKAKSTNITGDVLPEYRNRFDATRNKKRPGLLGMNSGNSSPSLSAAETPRAGLSATSAPNDLTLRRQAMRTPLIHLLAMKPVSTEEIARPTHIPKTDLEAVVSKIAQHVEGKWKLLDRAYKDLDVWTFGYKTMEDRKMAIDNAIRAYDRMRVSKDDKMWQMLLPKEERGKGKVLSKLHLSAPQTNRGSTPNYMPSPQPGGSEDERPTSSANTPRPGQSGTPKIGATKSAGSDMKKRLLAKDPKKARAAEEAKEKRKREREVAASDRDSRPAKKQKPAGAATSSATSATSAKSSSKIKSAELVHSSDDEDEEGEVKEMPPQAAAPSNHETAKAKPKAASAPTPQGNDNPRTVKPVAKALSSTKAKASTPSTKTTTSPAVKPTNKTTTAGGSTPSQSSLAAPGRQRTQLSPSKGNSRPTVPSPLGAARPRNASDVSDRSAVGVQRTKQGGAGTPRGLGITTDSNGVRKKRQDTVTSRESFTSSDGDKRASGIKTTVKERTATTNGVPTQRAAVATSVKPSNPIKRKAEAPLARNQAGSDPKHRKTESTSSASQRSHSSSFGTVRTATTASGTSPDAVFDSGSSDSSGSVMDNITYEQGVEKAKNFRERFYPEYVKLYDSISDRQSKGDIIRQEEREKLWKMHRRLEEMKREIAVASKRERL